MKTNPFKVHTWLNVSIPLVQENQSPENELPSEFFAPNYLTPGWNGDGLLSRPALNIKNTMRMLYNDAILQFNALCNSNRSLKLSVYNEFICYVESKKSNDYELESFQGFWDQIKNQNTGQYKFLDDFIKIYCFRVICVFLYKIRFLAHLGEALDIPLTKNNFINPSSFLNKLFQKGSSSELFCESLQTNPYSWYRPSFTLEANIHRLRPDLFSISISQMMRICTYRPSNIHFSHSLSHKEFGIFLHQLLDTLPKWSGQDNGRDRSFLNCKFSGDHLISLSLAHWLASQDLTDKKETLLCPTFFGEGFLAGHYFRICQEIQLMTSLIKKAQKIKKDPKEYLCRIMKDTYFSCFEDFNGQMPMFGQNELRSEMVYSRIVVNLSNLSPKNPYNFLINKINQQKESLKKNGMLYVFSNQKLFTPGQSTKFEQLLKSFKLEGHIDLEKLQGRGEMPSYIYIFTNREKKRLNNSFDHSFQISKKESCFCFRWSGELFSFRELSGFIDELNVFFNKKNSVNIPLYQKKLGENLFFNFHQDAILDGKILYSTSQDPAQITHPSFFENLTNTCIPFSRFFHLELLNGHQESLKSKERLTSGLLGIHFKQEEKYPLILIVDHRNPADIKLDITTPKSYRAKLEQFGNVFFRYVGLLPKHPDLNLNAFREFFNTNIGNQIIQLSLGGSGLRGFKAKLTSLLIPRFFLDTKIMPSYIEKKLNFIKIVKEELLKIHPMELTEMYKELEQNLLHLASDYPWQVLGLLCQFKYNINTCLSSINQTKQLSVDFSNPLFMESLLKLKIRPVYPENRDIYIDFAINKTGELHVPITDIKQKNKGKDHYLQVFSQENLILNIYSSREMLTFIQYILKGTPNIPASHLLKELKVPCEKELIAIVKKFKSMDEGIQSIHKSLQKLISNIMIQQISTGKQLPSENLGHRSQHLTSFFKNEKK